MSRLAEVSRKDANPLVRLIYRATRREVGRMIEPIAVMAHVPRLLLGYGMQEKALAGSHRVDERLEELAVLKAATIVGCEFCIDIGSYLARRGGITDAQLLALPHYADSDLFTPVEKLVLDYAGAMTRTPTSVDENLFARLREHFDEPQIVELTFAIAVENMRARFNWALGIGATGFSEGMVCAVSEAA